MRNNIHDPTDELEQIGTVIDQLPDDLYTVVCDKLINSCDWLLSEPYKPTSDDQAIINNVFEEKLAKNRADKNRGYDLFNGYIIEAILSIDDQNGRGLIQLIPFRYADYLARNKVSDKNIITAVIGVISLIFTADQKIIIGSRDMSTPKGSDDYDLQFPAGYYDSNDKNTAIMKKMLHEGKSFYDLCGVQGEREIREELLDFPDGTLIFGGNIGYNIQSVGDKFKIHEVFSIFRTTFTFDQLKKLRDEQIEYLQSELKAGRSIDEIKGPKDYTEITKIEGMSIAKLVRVLCNGFEIDFGGKKRKLVCNLPSGLKMLSYMMLKKSAQQMMNF